MLLDIQQIPSENSATHSIKMDASPQPIDSTTTILDLNDDCLREVFDLINIDGLTVVADICARFRDIAVKAASLKINSLQLNDNSGKRTYAKLRIFGSLMNTVNVEVIGRTSSTPEFENALVVLLSKYCTGNCIELNFKFFNITDGIALLMVPLLGRVRKITFVYCHLGGEYLKNMLLWSPELHELKFEVCVLPRRVHFGFLEQNSQSKLKSIWFEQTNKVDNYNIGKLLKQNPLLKKINLISCNCVDDRAFESIAKYVPKIEQIYFVTPHSTNKNYARYFGQLRELKILHITLRSRSYEYANADSFVQLAVFEISSNNKVLEELVLSGFNLYHESPKFVEGISKLQKLKKIHLEYFLGMTAFHLLDMCTPLKELMEIVLVASDLKLTQDDLLNFIQNANKLRKFTFIPMKCEYRCRMKFDVNAFKQLVNILDQRVEKTKLNLTLGWADTKGISKELTEAASDLLHLETLIYND